MGLFTNYKKLYLKERHDAAYYSYLADHSDDLRRETEKKLADAECTIALRNQIIDNLHTQLQNKWDDEDKYADYLTKRNEELSDSNDFLRERNNELSAQLRNIEKEKSQLEAKFRVVDNAVGRVTKDRDRYKDAYESSQKVVDGLIEEKYVYWESTGFFGSLWTKLINNYSNGKRILIKNNELEALIKQVEEQTGIKLNDIYNKLADVDDEKQDEEEDDEE